MDSLNLVKKTRIKFVLPDVQFTKTGDVAWALVKDGLQSAISSVDKFGTRLKRVSLQFIAPIDLAYDKLHPDETSKLLEASGMEDSTSGNLDKLLMTSAEQLPVSYEYIFKRLPYLKKKGEIVSFSFYGDSIREDTFIIIGQAGMTKTEATAFKLGKVNVEVTAQIEYPRTKKTTLQRRLTQEKPTTIKRQQYKPRRAKPTYSKYKPKRKAFRKRKYH